MSQKFLAYHEPSQTISDCQSLHTSLTLFFYTTTSMYFAEQNWEQDDVAPPAVQVIGMEIFFDTSSCCSGSGKQVKAVQGITYGIEKDQLFVLLGHNGAGKTTTINALVGNLRQTSGDALVFGHSCNTDMRTINKIMGVCPQHDILWDQLTGREHLELFAALRGMPGT